MQIQLSKNIIYSSFSILSTLLLLGCAGAKQTDLKPSTRTMPLVFDRAIVWRQSDNWTGEIESTISAGQYNVIGEDNKGTYYKGSSNCYTEKFITPNWNATGVKPGDAYTIDCGINVPFDSSQKIRLFHIEGTGTWLRAKDTQSSITPGASGMDAAVIQATTTNTANAPMSPMQAGIGAGIGSAVAAGLLELRAGSLQNNNIVKAPPELINKIQSQLKY